MRVGPSPSENGRHVVHPAALRGAPTPNAQVSGASGQPCGVPVLHQCSLDTAGAKCVFAVWGGMSCSIPTFCTQQGLQCFPYIADTQYLTPVQRRCSVPPLCIQQALSTNVLHIAGPNTCLLHTAGARYMLAVHTQIWGFTHTSLWCLYGWVFPCRSLWDYPGVSRGGGIQVHLLLWG